MEDYYSIQECADKIKVNHHTIRRAIKAEKIIAHQVGGKLWRIKKTDFENYISGGNQNTDNNK